MPGNFSVHDQTAEQKMKQENINRRIRKFDHKHAQKFSKKMKRTGEPTAIVQKGIKRLAHPSKAHVQPH